MTLQEEFPALADGPTAVRAEHLSASHRSKNQAMQNKRLRSMILPVRRGRHYERVLMSRHGCKVVGITEKP